MADKKAKEAAPAKMASSDAPAPDFERNRPKNTRDPAAPASGIVINNPNEKNPAATTGSRFFSSSINDEWRVVNAHFTPMNSTVFKNEQEASDEAARMNGLPEAATLDIE